MYYTHSHTTFPSLSSLFPSFHIFFLYLCFHCGSLSASLKLSFSLSFVTGSFYSLFSSLLRLSLSLSLSLSLFFLLQLHLMLCKLTPSHSTQEAQSLTYTLTLTPHLLSTHPA